MSDFEVYLQLAVGALYLAFIWFWGGPSNNPLTRWVRNKLSRSVNAFGLSHGWQMYATAPLTVANHVAVEYRKAGELVGEADTSRYEFWKFFVTLSDRRDLLPNTLPFFAARGQERGLDFDSVFLVRFEKPRPALPPRWSDERFEATPNASDHPRTLAERKG